MDVKLKEFDMVDYFRFLKLKFDKQYAKELEDSFFGYLKRGIKNIFNKRRAYKYSILVNNKLAGSIAIYKNTHKNYELGFFVLREFRNKGVAIKAVENILEIAFKKLSFRKIKAVTDESNIISQKVLKKCGFEKVKIDKKEKEIVWEHKR
ncbi:MAG: GNAT family N-acetyltransferase [Nanoarchaeota archaeon]|nr:GNAT family N-acetyltransferase [Nanoarchaeota archaeon]MBU1028472.1 GNAT family N-acetyltransferase [Nanoarchaeota archaeon]